MKRIKKIILPLLLIFLTGCHAEYQLTINGDTYAEKVAIIGENSTEINELNDNWQVPIDKNDYLIGFDDAENMPTSIKNYAYNFSSSTLTFSNNFTKDSILASTAVSNCYNTLTVTSYEDTTVISTSPNAICFDKYPDLSSVTVKISVDRKVISNNADVSDGNTYIWRLNSSNASTKSIDMVLDDTSETYDTTSIISDSDNDDNSSNIKLLDKQMYIFAFILLIVLLLGYSIVSGIKNQDDDIE